jgi:hypothetical protein
MTRRGKLPPVRPRRLFTFFSALSLLLCVAVCALWVRSYWRVDQVHRRNDWAEGLVWVHVDLVCTSEQGFLVINYYAARQTLTQPQIGDRAEAVASAPGEPIWTSGRPSATVGGTKEAGGSPFYFSWTGGGPPQGSLQAWVRILVAPHVAVATVLAVAPSVCLLRGWRRLRYTRAGRCPSCGYDLRATPERCPECGRVPL